MRKMSITGALVLALAGLTGHARAQKPVVPQQEADFCSIVENANSAYSRLGHARDAAKEQQNGIRVEQIEQQMTSVFHRRNEDVFRFAKHEKFVVNNWLVAVENIRTSNMYCRVNTTSCILIDLHPLCSPITTFHARMEATPTYIQLLAAKQHGDQLVISGRLLKRFSHHLDEKDETAAPMKSEEFEESLRESGSVTEPEYGMDIVQIR